MSHTNNTNITLSAEQQSAVDMILGWAFDRDDSPYKGRQEFKLGGYAGTGKTTIMKAVRHVLEDGECPECFGAGCHKCCNGSVTSLSCTFASFTGKAVSVLRRKGIHDACTLHSLLYFVKQDEKTGELHWIRKPKLLNEQFDIDDPDILIVDEASMVSTELYDDLRRHRCKLLWVGDPGQLEPVGDNPNLMKEPDVVLNTIHRQAAESPILRLADDVRHRRGFVNRRCEGLECIGEPEGRQRLLEADVVLVGFNNIRTGLNREIRLRRGYQGLLQAGERIIVLQNNAAKGVFNGQMIEVREVTAIGEHVVQIEGMDPDTGINYTLDLWKPMLEGTLAKPDFTAKPWDRSKRPDRNWVQADYGYALTCHKAQGSEWDTVMVFEPTYWGSPSKPLFDKARWQYTAITRAAKRLIYCRK